VRTSTCEETIAFGDRYYWKANRTIPYFEKDGESSIFAPTKKPAGGLLSGEPKAFGRKVSAVRAIVERPFRVIKRQFGFVKVRFRGLARITV
jgi:IS5 family transposase